MSSGLSICHMERTSARSSIFSTPRGTNLPVILFVPGGGYVAGDKQVYDGFYENLGNYFAAHGYVTAVMKPDTNLRRPRGIRSSTLRSVSFWAVANKSD